MERIKDGVEFLELGSDSVLRFTNKDLRVLHETLGDNYFKEATVRFDALDLKWIEAFLQHGGKSATGKAKPIKLEEVEEIPLKVVAERCLDALYLRVDGLSFEDSMLKRLRDREALTKRIEASEIGADE